MCASSFDFCHLSVTLCSHYMCLQFLQRHCCNPSESPAFKPLDNKIHSRVTLTHLSLPPSLLPIRQSAYTLRVTRHLKWLDTSYTTHACMVTMVAVLRQSINTRIQNSELCRYYKIPHFCERAFALATACACACVTKPAVRTSSLTCVYVHVCAPVKAPMQTLQALLAVV